MVRSSPSLIRTLAVAYVAATAVAQVPDSLVAEVDARFAPGLEDGTFVGVAVGLAIGHDVRYAGYGQFAEDDPRVPDEHTVFEIGSISKTFNGVLLALAVVEGKAQLDDTLQSHLAEGEHAPGDAETPIRLLHLATHSAGLPRLPTNFAPADAGNPYVDFDDDVLRAYFAIAKLERPPGTGYEYSNLGAAVLGHALDRIWGRPAADMFATRLFAPLGLRETAITLDDEMAARLAPPHRKREQRGTNWDFPVFPGIGGIRSTVADMIAWARAHISPAGDLAAALGLATEPHFAIPGGAVGLGWHLTSSGTIWHNGGTGGYGSFVGFDRTQGTAVAILANAATRQPTDLGMLMLEMLNAEARRRATSR